MNKTELVKKIADAAGITSAQAKAALDDILRVTGRLKCISGMDTEWYPLDTPTFKYHKG